MRYDLPCHLTMPPARITRDNPESQLSFNMPEPVTIAIVCTSATIISYFGFKALSATPVEIAKEAKTVPIDIIKSISAELRSLFGATPTITASTTIVQEAPKQICELYFHKQVITVREELKAKRFGSEKHFEVEQRFWIKAGFNLNRIKIDANEKNRTLTVIVPAPLIMSVEYHSPYRVIKEESGWWNWIGSEERDRTINALPKKTFDKAVTAEICSLTLHSFERVFRSFCDRHNFALQLNWTGTGAEPRFSSALHGIAPEALIKLGLEECEWPKADDSRGV